MALLADRDAAFAEVATRNAELFESCTSGGLLYGGMHLQSRGHAPCIQHTLCHAKGLAAALDVDVVPATSSTLDTSDVIRVFNDIATSVARNGSWRFTVSAYDHPSFATPRNAHPMGGSLAMLWHERTGALACGSMVEYTPLEPSNMPVASDPRDAACLTPRLVANVGGIEYRSDLDGYAEVESQSGSSIIVRGRLLAADLSEPASGTIAFTCLYEANGDRFTITASVSGGFGATF